ncbi:MAG: hypothetical protein SGARI_000863 [Bacillariaceae sp.]
MDFAVSAGEPPSPSPAQGDVSREGESGEATGAEINEAQLRKVTLESDEIQEVIAVVNANGDAMEVDDTDEMGTKISSKVSRGNKKKPNVDKDDESISDDEPAAEDEETGKFDFMPQGFNPGMASLFDIGHLETPAKIDNIDLEVVYFQGKSFRKGKCYQFQDEKGNPIVVGIKSFRSEKTANCVLIRHISDTFLGHDDKEGEFAAAVASHYTTLYVQWGYPRSIRVSQLGDESKDPADVPKLIYEPQSTNSRMSFAYVRDNDTMNIVRIPRNEIRLVEGFSGAGGMHIGYEEEGYTTVCAVEYNKEAVATFKHNNPKVPTYRGDIRKFIDRIKHDETYRQSLGRVDVIHTSSPCQGFSKANRNTFETDRDKANNTLSYTYSQLLETTGALVGVFENVEGMWSRKGMPYLKKILLDCIRLGYQVRVKVLKSSAYGDPQERPRLIIIAAKNFVPMPDHPAPTHGKARSLQPFVTCKQRLEPYLSPHCKMLPNMEQRPLPDKETKEERPVLLPNSFAPTLLASKSEVIHYAERRLLSVREQAALQSFPDDYVFLGSVRDQVRQVGNAVPVELSRNIARSVKECLRFRYIEEDGFSVEAAVSDRRKKGPLPVDVDEDVVAEDLENVDEDEDNSMDETENQQSEETTGEDEMMVMEEQPATGSTGGLVAETDEAMAE